MTVRSSSEQLPVRCAVCQRTATATLVVADFAPLGRARWIQLPPGWWQLLGMAPGADLHCRCAECLQVQPAPERRASSRIEGRWYVTERAVREYAHLMRPRPLDDEQATDELIELSRQAHRVREQDNGLTLWRVKAPNGFRIRLLVGPAQGIRGHAADAIVQVLGEHAGANRRR